MMPRRMLVEVALAAKVREVPDWSNVDRAPACVSS